MTNSHGVKYGAKNDGPKVRPFDDAEAAKAFAAEVGGKVIALDADGKEKRSPARPASDKPTTPPAAG